MLGSLFTRSIGSVPWARNNDDGWGYFPGDPQGAPSWTGVAVDANTATQLLTVYGCVRLITDQISTLPVDVFRRDSDGSPVELTKPAWLDNPSTTLTWADWCGQVLYSLLLAGNAYVAISRNASTTAIIEAVPLDPLKVQPYRPAGNTGRLRWKINGVEVPGLEVLHIKAVMRPGSDVGLSPIEAARQSVGLGLAAQRFGAEFFAGEGNMPGVIESPRPMEPDTMRELASQWRRKRSSGGRGLPGVLQNGATWKPTGINNEQAQFLQTRNYSAAEIAGQMFLVDPSELGIPVQGSNLTYQNLEQRNVRRLQVTLLPWIIRIEQAVSALLARPRYIKLNVSGILRGDQKTRYESYAIGITNGFLEPNEPRLWEDLRPLPEADTPPPPEADDVDDDAA